jgi:hypothetical protein
MRIGRWRVLLPACCCVQPELHFCFGVVSTYSVRSSTWATTLGQLRQLRQLCVRVCVSAESLFSTELYHIVS